MLYYVNLPVTLRETTQTKSEMKMFIYFYVETILETAFQKFYKE